MTSKSYQVFNVPGTRQTMVSQAGLSPNGVNFLIVSTGHTLEIIKKETKTRKLIEIEARQR